MGEFVELDSQRPHVNVSLRRLGLAEVRVLPVAMLESFVAGEELHPDSEIVIRAIVQDWLDGNGVQTTG